MALDKNIAALLNEKAYTIGVQFQHSLGDSFQEYTYVTDLPKAVHTDYVDGITPQTILVEGIRTGGMVLVPTRIHAKYDEKSDSTMLLEKGIRMSIAIVTRIDEEVKISPDDSIAYGWVIATVDNSNYFKTKSRNSEIESLVQEAYTQNLRRSFANQILGGLEDGAKDRIKLLLGAK